MSKIDQLKADIASIEATYADADDYQMLELERISNHLREALRLATVAKVDAVIESIKSRNDIY